MDVGNNSKHQNKKTQHMRQHQNARKHLLYRYNLDKQGKIDSRYMIYMGIPLPEETHGLIYYNQETQLWHCAKCERAEKPQEGRNLIHRSITPHREIKIFTRYKNKQLGR